MKNKTKVTFKIGIGLMERLILSTKLAVILLVMLLLHGCISTQPVGKNKWGISLQGGVNKGGIIENTDMDVVPGAFAPPEAEVDAFSGATKLKYNGGIHINRQLKRNQLETGIDYMFNYHTFNYIDAGNFYMGVRRLEVSQVMVPLTYNFVFLKNRFPAAELQFKAGYLGQLNFVNTKETGILPEYSIQPFSHGLTFGISAYPLQFQNGSKLGFYIDGYRGSQIYEDFYNQKNFDMPGSSYLKGGIRYQFK